MEDLVANNRYNTSTCPVCWDDFPLAGAVALLRPCDHVLCRRCYGRHVNVQLRTPNPTISCPVCRGGVTDDEAPIFAKVPLVDLTTPPTPPLAPTPTPQVNVSPLQLPPVASNAPLDDGIRVTGSDAPIVPPATFNARFDDAPRRAATSRPARRRRNRSRIENSTVRNARRRNREIVARNSVSYQLSRHIELRTTTMIENAIGFLAHLDSINPSHPGQAEIIARLRQSLMEQVDDNLDHLSELPSPSNNS